MAFFDLFFEMNNYLSLLQGKKPCKNKPCVTMFFKRDNLEIKSPFTYRTGKRQKVKDILNIIIEHYEKAFTVRTIWKNSPYR